MRILFLIPILLFAFQGTAQAQPSGGDEYELSVMTCAPGEYIYSSFGHTAIRVKNPAKGTDQVYNFGTFDFRTPNFYLKFIRGNLDYFLSIDSFESFVDDYSFSGRAVVEQRLDLPREYVLQIVDELNRLSEPENRYYRYKFINHNCTTAVKDLLIPHLSECNPVLGESTGYTHRQFLERYLYDKPWVRTGINLIMGSRTDTVTTLDESMFLPDQLMDGLERLDYKGRPIVLETRVVNEEQFPLYENNFLERFYPALIVLAVCAVLILWRSRIADAAFLALLGMLGLLLCFLMLFCGHIEFKSNYNLLWCNPLLLVCSAAVIYRRTKTLLLTAAMMSVFVFIMLIIWILGVQGFEWSFLFASVTAVWILIRRALPLSPAAIMPKV